MVTAPRRNVVDSSSSLSYLDDESGAARFAAAIEDTEQLVVPTVCLLEVFKIVARQSGACETLQAVYVMQQGTVIDPDAALALSAARLSGVYKLPLAESVVYTTMQQVGGILWTRDIDFSGLPDVQYIPTSPR